MGAKIFWMGAKKAKKTELTVHCVADLGSIYFGNDSHSDSEAIFPLLSQLSQHICEAQDDRY